MFDFFIQSGPAVMAIGKACLIAPETSWLRFLGACNLRVVMEDLLDDCWCDVNHGGQGGWGLKRHEATTMNLDEAGR